MFLFQNLILFLTAFFSDIKVVEADMLDLPFGSECFDVVIEKGTMVCIIYKTSLHISIRMKKLIVLN